jgi:hypothetical protein
MSGNKKEDEMICALTAEESAALQRGLNELPDTMPPRDVWHRIREQAEAEGLIRAKVLQRRSTWYTGIGVAAAALVAAIMLPGLLRGPPARAAERTTGATRRHHGHDFGPGRPDSGD